jgi:hypothetical protein
MKISDHRLTVFMMSIFPSYQLYSGAIAERTDPSADTGYIYIRITRNGDRGRLNQELGVVANDYYAIYWYTDNGKKRFSVHGDHQDNTNSDLTTLKNYTALDPYFLEVDDPHYEGVADGLNSANGYDWVYVGFTKDE